MQSNMHIDSNVEMPLTASLLQKYSVNIPRYTSYPTAPEWIERFTKEDFLRTNDLSNKNKTPISLYFHLPFCESHCYFCGCNVVISKKREILNPYLLYLKKEIEILSKLINPERKVVQIHLGGGTPTYLNSDELNDLLLVVKNSFNFSSTIEAGVEVDPRVTNSNHLQALANHGFNRLSMGVQDFDLKVQEAVNRIQPYELTHKLFTEARELGFKSINVDLIYGLPYQTKESFKKTIDLVLELNPDRIALFHYAHLPQMLKHQDKYISSDTLPSTEIKTIIFQMAAQMLTDNGYMFIGLDHFAKSNDELYIAKRNKTLHRNFQGYTTCGDSDLYGLGISAISNIQNSFSQNEKKLNSYYEKLDRNEIPFFRGFVLNNDDELRREVIMKILCHGELDMAEIEKKYNIQFSTHFSFELEKINSLKDDGLVSIKNDFIWVTEAGQYFLRNIACVFDAYLQKNGKQKIYSKSV